MDKINNVLKLAMQKFYENGGCNARRDEFATVLNDGVLIIGKVDKELKIKFLLGKYFLDITTGLLNDGDEEKKLDGECNHNLARLKKILINKISYKDLFTMENFKVRCISNDDGWALQKEKFMSLSMDSLDGIMRHKYESFNDFVDLTRLFHFELFQHHIINQSSNPTQ